MKKNKKGSATDLFVFMIVAFMLSIICVIMYYVSSVTHEKLLEEAEDIQNVLGDHGNATQIIEDSMGKVKDSYESLKWISGLIIIGMALSILITSFMIRTEPVFFIAYAFVWIIAIIVSVPLSNVYETVYENPTLSASFEGFYAQTWIFLNLPTWIIVIGGIAGLLMIVNLVRASREYG